MTLEIKQLHNFAKVADLGNLTRAASSLGLTQTGLSRQIAGLEAEMGVALFRRNGRGLMLTAAGRRLQEHAHVILRQVAQAYRSVAEAADDAPGPLALGLTTSLGRTMVVPLIAAFKTQLPRAAMRSVEGHSLQLMDLVATGKLDCAVVYDPIARAGLDLLSLVRERFYLVSGPVGAAGCPLAGDVALADLAELPLISPGKLYAVHLALTAALGAMGKQAKVVHEVANLNAILDLVRGGHGYAVLPMSGIHSCIGDSLLGIHDIRDPDLGCELVIAFVRDAASDPLLQTAVQIVRTVVVDELKRMRADLDANVRRSRSDRWSQ